MRALSDPDTDRVAALLRAAVRTSGMTQGDYARALGTSPSRFSTYLSGRTRPSAHFVVRAQRLAESSRSTEAAGLMSSVTTGRAVGEQLRAEDLPWAWRMLLQGRDHLRLLLDRQDNALLGSWELVPVSTGSSGFDALLAAVSRQEFLSAGRVPPTWTSQDPLPHPWIPDHPFLSPDGVRSATPGWLRALNIFVPDRDLVTA